MDLEEIYAYLLAETRAAYEGHSRLTSFAPFPDDVVRQDITPFHRPCADVFAENTTLAGGIYDGLHNSIKAAGPKAVWRATYKGTGIGDDFMRRFGCYSIIGQGGPFTSKKVWMWMTYMPADFYYPWHHHPGEEIYMVVAGSAVFQRVEAPDETLGPGGTVYHESNQSHAMYTKADPVLCLVAWRNRFETPPVLTGI